MIALVAFKVLPDILAAPIPGPKRYRNSPGRAGATEGLRAKAVAFAEVSIGVLELGVVEETPAEAEIAVPPIPHAAPWRAGKVFLACHRRGGIRTGVLPAFLIGGACRGGVAAAAGP